MTTNHGGPRKGATIKGERNMKKIINGLRYDTEKAVEIGNFYTNISMKDFRWMDVTLYKTPRSGRFFLAGEGGPMTRFGRSNGDGTSGFGSKIIPMTTQEALEWAEQYMETADIKKHFDIKEA